MHFALFALDRDSGPYAEAGLFRAVEIGPWKRAVDAP